MVKPYRVAVIGLAHDHYQGLVKQFQDCNAKIVAAADENKAKLEKVKADFGVKALYKGYHELLRKEKADAVLCCSENARHGEITEAAAEKGLHVMVEKPMAASLEEAERMLRASQKSKIKLMVNWPTAWVPANRMAHSLIREGAVGKVLQIRFRGGHWGPRVIMKYSIEQAAKFWFYIKALGGGVLLDYCCYASNYFLWFLEQPPRSVVGMAGTLLEDFSDVEDNAVLVVRFDKQICLSEASWTIMGREPPHGPVINGSDGVIALDGSNIILSTMAAFEPKPLAPLPMPVGVRSGPEYFLTRIEQDKPIEGPVSPKLSRDVQEILEAGRISVETGRLVSLPLK